MNGNRSWPTGGALDCADAARGPVKPSATAYAARLRLSRRQSQVLDALVTGRPYKDAARALRMSYSTFRTHMEKIQSQGGTEDYETAHCDDLSPDDCGIDGPDPTAHYGDRQLFRRSRVNRFGRSSPHHDKLEPRFDCVRWGFAKEVGPIELLDVVGCDKAARMMQDLGIKVPKLLEEVISTTGRIYEPAIDGSTIFFDVKEKKMKTEKPDPTVIGLGVLRNQGLVVRENINARLLNLGDGVLCCELDAKMVPTMNPVDDYIISMMQQAKELCDSGKFKALVISNQASNFCAGAQLQMILELCKAKKWKLIEAVSRDLQEINVGLYHAGFPVVTAPHGMTLGGGLEITLAGHKRVPYTELYCGLVEVGVGLIPAGGGCMGLLRQFQQVLAKANPGPMAVTMKAFENIGFGKVSMSAHDSSTDERPAGIRGGPEGVVSPEQGFSRSIAPRSIRQRNHRVGGKARSA